MGAFRLFRSVFNRLKVLVYFRLFLMIDRIFISLDDPSRSSIFAFLNDEKNIVYIKKYLSPGWPNVRILFF